MSAARRVGSRQPIVATPGELSGFGIDYHSDDLFRGCSAIEGNHQVHFGLQRLTARSLSFWRYYRMSCGRMADLLAKLAGKVERASMTDLELESLADEYGWTRRRMREVVEVIRQRSYGARRIFRKLKGGVTGIEWLLDKEFAPTEDRFVAYVAKAPLAVDPPVAPERPPTAVADLMATHERLYSSLLVTVGVATASGLPTVTHFGIFRNPLSFLEAEPSHRGLAMQLHGFAASVALYAWSGKVFMTTNPMPRMSEVVQQAVSAGDVYVADNDDDLRAYINRNLPPGVAPVETGRFSFAGFTARSRPIAVRLDALSRQYRPVD